MEFNKNHFYKLTKEIPVKQLFQLPSWYDGAASYGYYGNSNTYSTYTISTCDGNGIIISNAFSREASKRFTIGRIYQAFSKTGLYDDMGSMYSLYGNEIECFEEVEIGLNEISKRFMEKHINSGKMAFKFNFLDNNMVALRMTLNGKHSTCVSLICVMGQVNEMLHNAYIVLRKSYIKKIKTYLEVNYGWSTLIGGDGNYIYHIRTNGVFGRI